MKLFMSLLLLSSVAHAGYYVECGEAKVEFRAQTVDDIFSGKNEANWNVSIGERWLEEGVARNRMYQTELSKSLQVSITQGSGPSTMGRMYEISDLNVTNPELNVYEVGGFVGYVHIAKYNCQAQKTEVASEETTQKY